MIAQLQRTPLYTEIWAWRIIRISQEELWEIYRVPFNIHPRGPTVNLSAPVLLIVG